MKWLLVVPVMIAACSIVKASPNALAFEFAQGVIVDPAASVVYLMNPEGGIDAVSLSGGAVIATTARGAKPLLLYDDALLARAEDKDGCRLLSLVSLSTKDLKPAFTVDVPLPLEIQAPASGRLGCSFYASARIDSNVIVVQWRSIRYPISAIPTREAARVAMGFARIDPANGRLMVSGEGEPSASGTPRNEIPPDVQKLANSGALASPLCVSDHLIAALQYVEGDGGNHVTLRRWNKPTGEALADIGLIDSELTFRNFSRDCRHLLASKAENEENWYIYSVATGKRLMAIHNSLLGAAFFVWGESLVYETPSVERLISGQFTIVQPRQLQAIDLATGQELWARPIRETAYRGSVPGQHSNP
jgi:hypothetical protein